MIAVLSTSTQRQVMCRSAGPATTCGSRSICRSRWEVFLSLAEFPASTRTAQAHGRGAMAWPRARMSAAARVNRAFAAAGGCGTGNRTPGECVASGMHHVSRRSTPVSAARERRLAPDARREAPDDVVPPGMLRPARSRDGVPLRTDTPVAGVPALRNADDRVGHRRPRRVSICHQPAREPARQTSARSPACPDW